MIARAATGWQTMLADLSLILFLVTAAAVTQPPRAHSPVPAAPVLPALGEPVAVWTETRGGPSLAAWLAAQPFDPRQRLTLVAAPDEAGRVQALARTAGRPVRLVLDPGIDRPPFAALTYDQSGQMARGLLDDGQ